VRHAKLRRPSQMDPMHPQTPECTKGAGHGASQPTVRPWWRSMRPRGHASWPNRAASHKRFDRDIMFGHVLETAARPAACWSAARPREATSTTTMLISPPPGLAPNGLSPLLGASRLAGGISQRMLGLTLVLLCSSLHRAQHHHDSCTL
jgi:hypothetical protein